MILVRMTELRFTYKSLIPPFYSGIYVVSTLVRIRKSICFLATANASVVPQFILLSVSQTTRRASDN